MSSSSNHSHNHSTEKVVEVSNAFIFNKEIISQLYNKYKGNFEKYLKRHQDSMNFVIDNKTQKKIKATDFLSHRNETKLFQLRLTPIPYVSRRKIVDENGRKEFYNVKRSIVSMRRLEYTSELQRSTSNQYTKSQKGRVKPRLAYIYSMPRIKSGVIKTSKAIIIQSAYRGHFLRKVYRQVEELNRQFTIFLNAIKAYMLKGMFNVFHNSITINKRCNALNSNYSEQRSVKNKYGFNKGNNNDIDMSRDIELQYNMSKETANVGIQVKESLIDNDVDVNAAANVDIDLRKENTVLDVKSINIKRKIKTIKYQDRRSGDIVIKQNLKSKNDHCIMDQYNPRHSCDTQYNDNGNGNGNAFNRNINESCINKSKPLLPLSFMTKLIIERKFIHYPYDTQLNFTSASSRIYRQVNSEMQCIDKDVVPIILNEDILTQQNKCLKGKQKGKGKGKARDKDTKEKNIIKDEDAKEGINTSLLNKHSKTKNSFITKHRCSFPLKKIILIQKYFRSNIKANLNHHYQDGKDKRRINDANKEDSIGSRIQKLFLQIIKNKVVSNSKRIGFMILKSHHYSLINNESSKATILDDYMQDDANYQIKKKNYIQVAEGLRLHSLKVKRNRKNNTLVNDNDNDNNTSLQIIESEEGSDLEEIIDNYCSIDL